MTIKQAPSSSIGRGLRVLLAATIGLTALLVGSTDASAGAGPPPESGLECTTMKPNNCWAHQVVFRGDPMLEFLNWTSKKWPKGFNYDSNGCSVGKAKKIIRDTPLPDGLLSVIDDYAKFFRTPCRVHDFGYRNFGSGTQKTWKQYHVRDRFLTENQKSWNEPNQKLKIDHRFGDLMHKRCANGNPPEMPGSDRWWCDKAADAFEKAVRKYGEIDA